MKNRMSWSAGYRNWENERILFVINERNEVDFNMIHKIYNVFASGLEWFAKISLVVMTLIVFVDVVLRYIFKQGFSWTQEVATLLLVWFSLIGMAIGVVERIHISIEMFTSKLSKRAIAFLELLDHILISLFGCAMIYYGIVVMKLTSKSTLPATKLPSAVLYIILPLSGVLIILNAVIVSIRSVRKMKKEEGE